MEISIATPATFNFKRTVISHGWCELLPFRMDRENWVLSRVLDLPGARPVTLSVTANKRALRILTSRRLSQAAAKKVINDIRHMLRLDDDMGEFYRHAQRHLCSNRSASAGSGSAAGLLPAGEQS